MDEARIRQIFAEEFAKKIGQDKYVFTRNVQLANGRNFEFGKNDGTQIGTETSQKLAFYGSTPVIQQGAVSSPSGGATVDSQARTAIDQIRSTLITYGFLATS